MTVRLITTVLHPSTRLTLIRPGLPCIRITTALNRMMSSSTGTSRGDSDQVFIYGTAWKKNQTKQLVKEALVTGFRRVDTAAQPRHYQEDLVGAGIREAIAEGIVKREDLYVSKQTTLINGANIHRFKQSTHPLMAKILTICHTTPKIPWTSRSTPL